MGSRLAETKEPKTGEEPVSESVAKTRAQSAFTSVYSAFMRDFLAQNRPPGIINGPGQY